MFSYVDAFVDGKVAAVNAVIQQLAPRVAMWLDECGTE
jgi:hypothetical protein